MERDVLDALDLRERHHEMQAMLLGADDPALVGSARLMTVSPGAALVGAVTGGDHLAAVDEAVDEETWEFLTGGNSGQNIRSPLGGDVDADPSDSLLDSHSAVSYKRLVQAHQLCCAEREGLQLQVNHLQLQVASLQMQNRRLNSKVNEMNLELSEAAERELLQKTKVRDMINFDRIAASRSPADGTTAPSPHWDSMMQSMYEDAKSKMREMTSEIASLEENLTRREEIHAAQVLSLETNLEGMKRQFVSLSDQLAQRTVLYESQERRWRSMLTSKSSLFTERSNEFVKLSARFEQLQEQFLRVDAERLDAVVDNRELRATLSNLHAEHSDEKERLSIAEQELSTATQRIQDIQIELERIKGTDITELEQSMAAEALLIRERASDRENEIMRQVEHLRESLAQVSMEKEQFLDEIHHLKQHNRSLEELLHELRNHNFDGSHTLELSHVDHHYDGNSELASSAVVAEPRAVASQVNGVRGQSACGSEECYESDVDDDYGAAAGGDGGGEEEAAAATERTQGLDESYLTGQSGRSEADEMSALLRQRTYEASEAKSRKLELQLQEKQAECGFLISNIGILKEQVQNYREALAQADADLKAAVDVEKMRWENEISELTCGYEAGVRRLNEDWVAKYEGWSAERQDFIRKIEYTSSSVQRYEAELIEASARAATAERRLEEHMSETSQRMADSEDRYNQVISMLEQKHSEIAEMTVAHQGEIGTLSKEIQDAHEEISKLRQKLDDMLSVCSEKLSLEQRIADLHFKVQGFEEDAKDLDTTIKSYANNHDAIALLIRDSAPQSAAQLVRNLLEEFIKLKSEMAASEEARKIESSESQILISTLESEKLDAIQKVDSLREKIASLEQDAQLRDTSHGMAAIKAESLEFAISQMEESLRARNDENVKLKSEILELKETAIATADLRRMESDHSRLISTILDLHTEIHNYYPAVETDYQTNTSPSAADLLESIRSMTRHLAKQSNPHKSVGENALQSMELSRKIESLEVELSETKRDMLLLSLELDSRTKEYDIRVRDLHERLAEVNSLLASSELQNSEWQEKIEKLSNKYESNELQLQSQIYEMQLRMHSESITSLRSLDGKSSDDLLSRDETIAKLQVELSSKQVAIERLIRDVAHNNNSDFATEIQASTHAESLKDMLQKRISELESERSLLLEQTSAISVEKNTLKNTLQKTLDDLSIMEVQFRDAQHRYSECERRLVQANAAIRVQEESLQTRLTSLETEKQTLSVEYSKLQNQFVALQNTNGELRADWEHMKSLYLGTKLNRDEIYEKLSGCEKDLDSLRKQNYDLEKSAQTLSQSKLAIERSLSEQLSARIQQLETDKRAAEELLKKTVLERRDFEEKLRLVERQLANALSDRRLRDAAYSKLMESHTALEAEASTLREERRALLAERTELQLSRDDLAQQLASSEREISRLNTRLSSVEAMLASVPESSEQVSRALRLAEEKITKYAVEKTELQNKLIFFEGNIKSLRRSLREKYRSKYDELKAKFFSEREELLLMVRRECDDIIAQAQQLVLRSKRENTSPEPRRSRAESPIKKEAEAMASSLRTSRSLTASLEGTQVRRSLTVHPEMLSPEETQTLVRSVLERVAASTWDEFRSSYQFSNREGLVSSIDASVQRM